MMLSYGEKKFCLFWGLISEGINKGFMVMINSKFKFKTE